MNENLQKQHGYVPDEYLIAAGKVLEPLKSRTYDMLELKPSGRYLDVGCGPGIDVRGMYTIVSPPGAVYGADHDFNMLRVGVKSLRAGAYSAQVPFVNAAALTLPFKDNVFSGVRSERLLQHIGEPFAAVSEMFRVVSPGGYVVAADSDHGSLIIDCTDHDVEKEIISANAERLTNGYSGRRLAGFFNAVGSTDIEIESCAMHVRDYAVFSYLSEFEKAIAHALTKKKITMEQKNAFVNDLKARNEAGNFFAALMVILVRGKKHA